jgi:hypothetical protein
MIVAAAAVLRMIGTAPQDTPRPDDSHPPNREPQALALGNSALAIGSSA